MEHYYARTREHASGAFQDIGGDLFTYFINTGQASMCPKSLLFILLDRLNYLHGRVSSASENDDRCVYLGGVEDRG